VKIQFDVPPESAQETNGLAVRYAASKRKVPRWRWYLLLAMVLLPPAYLLTRFGVAYWWETTPAQVMIEQVTVRAPSVGRVVRIAQVGETLQPGQPVAELEAPAKEKMVQPLPLVAPAPAPAPAPTKLLQNQHARQTMLNEAHQLAQDQLAIQQARLQRMQDLWNQGAATRQEVDNARLQALQAQVEVSRARADIREHRTLLVQERMPTETQAPSAPNLAAKPEATAPSPVPATTAVASPAGAKVLRTLVHKGDWVAPGTDIAVVQTNAEPLVYAYLPAKEARYAQLGREATLRFMDGGRVRAKVVGLAPEVQGTPADRVSPLTPRTTSIVVRLQAVTPLPESYHIQQLPLDVRFDWVPASWF
jgi:multidrug resistance efflux pump